MQRRGNKSKKVPNVRLRPADADAMRRARARASPEPSSSCWVQDSQIVGSDDTVLVGGSVPRPFKNVIVCATGVLDKTSIFKLALELGATSVSAFTDRVTHLIAESHGGAKYQCALERKIPILTPSWIIESHRTWQHGDDVDLEESIVAHRLPVFSGVTLCISGINDILLRTKISKTLTENGGTYVKALERPVRVTHLLCTGDVETDKMRYAEKFNRAGEADPPIQLVWEEWFWDCVEFGGRFDEARYHVRHPRPERRVAEVHDAESRDKNSEAAELSAAIPSVYDEDADADELAPVQRLPAVTLELWGSLLKSRGYEIAGGGVMLSPKKARGMEQQGRQEVARPIPREGRSEGVLSTFRRADSFIMPRTTAAAASRISCEPGAGEGASRLPFGRSTSINNAVAGPSTTRAKRLGEGNSMLAPAVSSSADTPSTVFAGLQFLLRGEADTATVSDAIQGAGGSVFRDHDAPDHVDYIVVRLVSALFLKEKSPEARSRYRTECWVERCLLVDQISPANGHASFVPFGIPLPVPGADQIKLSFSGLDASEACWVRRLLKALGITLAAAFSRHSTHLLCPSGSGAKYDRALQWGVPVITMEWLATMSREGTVPDVHPFLINRKEEEDGLLLNVANVKPAGKGKEKADETMQDITNSYDSQESPPQKTFSLPPLPPPKPSVPVLSFGKPNASLGGSHEQPASPSPPKRRHSTHTPSRSRPTTPLPFIAHGLPVPTPTQSSRSNSTAPEPVPGVVRRSATFAAVGHVKEASRVLSSSSPARVPSSSSPSPLKRGVSVSPPKIPDHRTKALQESIVSLLGKRPATPEDAEAGRIGKRNRSHRSKAQSRNLSDALPVYAEPAAEELGAFGGGRSLSPGPEEGSYEGLSIGADEQSMRVMYEDPGQREERRRLASLVGVPLEGEAGDTRKRPRRSTRRGGF